MLNFAKKEKNDIGFLLVLVLLTLVSIYNYSSVPPMFDEGFYVYASSLIGESLRHWAVDGVKPNFELLSSQLVGIGYFTPGVVYINVPFYALFGEDVGTNINRIYMGLVNLTLYLLIYKELTTIVNLKLLHKFLFVFPFFMPFFQFYFISFNGDLVAALLAIIFILNLENKIAYRKSMGIKYFILSGFLLGFLVLIRSQYLLLPVLFIIRLIFALNMQLLAKSLISIIVMFFTLWHWNGMLSDKYGNMFMTTSVYEKDFVYDYNYSVNHVGVESTGLWTQVHSYMYRNAREQGITLREFIESERQFLKPLSIEDRLSMARESTRRFFFAPKEVLSFINKGTESAAMSIHEVLWYLLLFIFFISILYGFSCKNVSVLLLIIYGVFVILTSQALLYFSNGRYHIATIPVIVIASILSQASYSVKGEVYDIRWLRMSGYVFFCFYMLVLTMVGLSIWF